MERSEVIVDERPKAALSFTSLSQNQRPLDIRALTWNVLADCYSSDSKEVWEQERSKRVAAVLRQFSDYDLLLLEEVDHYNDFYRPLLASLGFSCCYVQRPTKTDGCLICYRSSRFTALKVEEIHFNDLIRMRDLSENTRNALCRHNVGLIVQLEAIGTEDEGTNSREDTTACAHATNKPPRMQFTVGVAHMFWNPAYPEIKSAQAEYFLSRLCIFARHFAVCSRDGATLHNWPIVVGGDYNATPSSEPYTIMTTPFYFPTDVPSLHSSIELKVITSTTIISKRFSDRCYYGGENTKFLCDADMSRLCRWLRLLGVDAAMHTPKRRNAVTPEEIAALRSAKKASSKMAGHRDIEQETSVSVEEPAPKSNKSVKPSPGRKSDEYSEIFERATREKRVILTTSKNMRLRAACPESMLIDPQNLEKSLVDIVKNYKIPLRRENFLTVCGKCGGAVVEITPEEYIAASRQYAARHEQQGTEPHILRSSYRKNKSISCSKGGKNQEGQLWVPRDRPIFMCVECTQPYWWNESETSTPARAMMLADCLFNMATRGLAEESATTDASPGAVGPLESDSGAAEAGGETIEKIQIVETKSIAATISEAESGKIATVDRETLVQMFATRDKHLVSYSKYHEENKSTSVFAEGSGSSGVVSGVSDCSLGNRQGDVDRMLKAQSKPEDLWLRSAHFLKHGTEPKYTNWTETFYGTLDYIFVSDLCAVLDADTAPRQSDAPRHGAPLAPTAEGWVSDLEKLDADTDTLGKHLAATTLSDSSSKPPPESSVPASLESTVVAGPFPSDSMPSDHIVVRATLRLLPPRTD